MNTPISQDVIFNQDHCPFCFHSLRNANYWANMSYKICPYCMGLSQVYKTSDVKPFYNPGNYRLYLDQAFTVRREMNLSLPIDVYLIDDDCRTRKIVTIQPLKKFSIR